MSVIEQLDGDVVQYLDENGTPVGDVSGFSDALLTSLYRTIRLVRHFDERAVSLQRQGRMGTYPPMFGHEAAQVGSALAIDPEDLVFPSYRESGAIIARGVDPSAPLLVWMGHEAGNAAFAEHNVFPISNPIATHIPHATGAALAAKRVGDDVATLAYFGDGATSEGDFHEGLNFAGVFDTPTVFFCTNNQWAISVPLDQQTKSETIAQKADAYGIEGVRVDGMDPLAVYQVTKEAVENAKRPRYGRLRPTLIEAHTYRLGAHSTSDDPTVYRDEAEVEEWKERDPVKRLETFLLDTGRLTEDDVDAIETEVSDVVADAIETAEAYEPSSMTEMFEHVYAENPAELARQADELGRYWKP